MVVSTKPASSTVVPSRILPHSLTLPDHGSVFDLLCITGRCTGVGLSYMVGCKVEEMFG